MATLIYCLCALLSTLCAYLLWKGYRRSKSSLLFWSALCFIGLTCNNLLVVFDRVVFAEIDLLTWRLSSTLISLSLMLVGLIWRRD